MTNNDSSDQAILADVVRALLGVKIVPISNLDASRAVPHVEAPVVSTRIPVALTSVSELFSSATVPAATAVALTPEAADDLRRDDLAPLQEIAFLDS